MACKKQTQKQSTCGGGLTREVIRVLGGLYNVEKVIHGETRGYQGDKKVRIPKRWRNRCLHIFVCDAEDGERAVLVHALKPGAIGRILGKRLEERGIHVC